MDFPLSEKQLEFVDNATAHINLAHGSVRSGKTVGTLFAFMEACFNCPDSDIWMVGYSSNTIFQNAIRLILESPQLAAFKPFCTWAPGKRELYFLDKTIHTLGAGDEGCMGAIQGKTMSLCYCDEMQLYPTSIINMLDTRLSRSHSKLFASMNPSHPDHELKKWIDKAEEGDSNYYSLHFTLEDNPFLEQSYKDRIKNSLTGVFYKRNYLGLWCLAEGAIFDFFDKDIHVVKKPPRNAEYWIAGIDYGTNNSFACVLVGISTGRFTQTGISRWVEKEWVWDSRKMGRQKTNSEYADDIEKFLEPYGVKSIYIDPSAASFRLELRRRGMRVVDADNDVINGLTFMTSEMAKGNLLVCSECTNLIREIQSYCWDSKKAIKGEDAPIKKDDHVIDSLRYCVHTHKVTPYGDVSEEARTLGSRRSVF